MEEGEKKVSFENEREEKTRRRGRKIHSQRIDTAGKGKGTETAAGEELLHDAADEGSWG